MSDYYRGWKGATSRHSASQKQRSWGISWPKKKKIWKKLLILVAAAGLLGFIIFGVLFAYYSFNLPDPNKLGSRVVPESTKIFDRNNELLYEIHGEAKRTLIPFEQIPSYTKQAAIAVEDKNFYKHSGISLTGIIRSALKNVFTNSRVGGSTITQQFVRNAVLTREKTYTRKLKEVVLSLQLERKYSKDEILQLYFNEIPYGSNAYGIEAAAQTFFGKNAKDLSLVESAYLAALPQAPTYYSPFGPHRDELNQRADTVLKLMAEQGYITKEEKELAQSTKVEFRAIGQGILAPHFVMYIQDILAQKYGEVSLREGGFKITTTLDLSLQKIAEEAVAKQVAINEKNYNATNASLVATDPNTGQVLAMVGSRDYFDKVHDGAVNVALRSRQPGSSFKPYVYASAFKSGMNPATVLLDVQTNFGNFGGKDYVPQNYDGQSHGPVSIRQALQGSLNVPAVKTVILTGIENSIDLAEKMGITTLGDRTRYGPSIVLGGGEVKLLDHVGAFGVFAALGIKHDITAILKIEDGRGNVLEEYKPSRGKEVLDPQVAYQINNVLSDNEARAYIFGRSNRLTIPGRAVAAKTGTTQEYHDAWTVGYTPSLAAGVWVGNNNNTAMKTRADGSVVAAPIWNEFMRRALEGKPAEDFKRPDGIVEVSIDPLSGKLPTQYTPSTKTEVFASFNTPNEPDGVHLPFVVNGETVVYSILHSEKPNDPLWEDPVRAWAVANGYPYPAGGDGTAQETGDTQIKITAPTKISSLPWKVIAEVSGKEEIAEVLFMLDGRVFNRATSSPYESTNSITGVDGIHTLSVQVTTKKGTTNSRAVTVEFALGQKLLLLDPQDNQSIKLPINLVAETNLGITAEEIKFIMRSAAGGEKIIPGKITKQQLSSKLTRFTLNWSETDSPPAGSYAIFSRAGNTTSNEAVIKIE